MGPIGMPEMIMIFLVLAILAGGALAVGVFIYFLVKRSVNRPVPPPPGSSPPPPLPRDS